MTDASEQSDFIEWPASTLEKIQAEEVLTPQDYVGAVVLLGESPCRIVSILGMGSNVVAFLLLDLNTGKEDKVLKIPRATFDELMVLEDRLKKSLKHLASNPDLVIRACDRVLALAPRNEAAAFDKAVALCVKGNYAAALEWFDVAISIDPQEPFNWLNKAFALSRLGKDTEALDTLGAGTSLNEEGIRNGLQEMEHWRVALSRSAARVFQSGSRTDDVVALCRRVGLSGPSKIARLTTVVKRWIRRTHR